MTEHTQEEFDSELRKMLHEARSEGQQFCRIVSEHLHDRVVREPQINRMPMACKAMWKLWEKQGGHNSRIIQTTPSNQSSTITIEFDTGLNKNLKVKKDEKVFKSGNTGLEEFVDESIKQSLEKGHTSKTFIDTRHQYGTVEAIKNLVTSKTIHVGLKRLAELGLLNLSMEEAVLKFPEEFTPAEQESARWRLEQVRKDFDSQYDIFSERKKRAKQGSEHYRRYEIPEELRNQILNVLKGVVSVFTRRDAFTQYWHNKWNDVWNIYCRKNGISPEKYDVIFAGQNCGKVIMENNMEDIFDIIDIAFQFMTKQKVPQDRLKEHAGELNSFFRNASVGYQLVENRMIRFDSKDKDTQTEMRQGRIDSLVKWFRGNYQDPRIQLPVDDNIGGYRWIYGGPYKANEVLANRFPEEHEEIIKAAVKEIESSGNDSWSPIPGPKNHNNEEPAHIGGSEDIVAELNTLIANSPTSQVAPAFHFGDDELLHIDSPPDLQTIESDDKVFEGLKVAKNNLIQALTGTNAHSSLLDAVEQYNQAFSDEQISISFLYVQGIVLENAVDTIKRNIESGDLPPFPVDIERNINSLLDLHASYIMSQEEGRARVEAASAYRQSPQQTEEVKVAAEKLNDFIASDSFCGEDVKEHAASVFPNIGKGSHPERSNHVATITVIGLTTAILRGVANNPAVGVIAGVALAESTPGAALATFGSDIINATWSFLSSAISLLSNAIPLLKTIVAPVASDASWVASLSELVDRFKNLQNPAKIEASEVPSMTDFLRPILRWASEQPGEFTLREASDAMADHFNLSAEARDELTKEGNVNRVYDRTNWAINPHLKEAELVHSIRRGYWKITEAGKKEAFASSERMSTNYLVHNFPAYRFWKERKKNNKE